MSREISYNLVLNAALHGNLVVAADNISKKLGDLSKAADELRKAYDATENKLNSSNLSQASAQAVQYRQELRQLHGQLNEIAVKQSRFRFNDSIGRAVGAYQNLGSTVGAIKNMASPFVGMVKTAMDFEAAMSKVQALSKASDSDLQDLTATAEKLGATTKFSATQSAEAMQYLALAGWDANQIIGGMPGLLSLAAASGEDLALCADIVSDQLTAFGMSAKQAGFMANTLAATSAAANTDVAQMGETLKYVGSVAGAAGYEFNDVAMAMGIMANASTKGSMAGTALRSTILRLVDTPKDAAKALAEINFDKLDSNGNLKSIMTQLDELREKTKGMSKDKLLEFSKNVAGQEAMAGFASLMTAKQDDWDKLKTTIEKANQGDKGAAEEMAKIMQNNTKGRVVEFQSAWEGLSIVIGKQVLPVLAPLIQRMTECISKAVEFGKVNPNIVQAGLALAGVAGSALIAVKGFIAVTSSIEAMQDGMKVLRTSGIANLFTGLAPSGGMFTGISKAFSGFVSKIGIFANLAIAKFTTPFKAAAGIFKMIGGALAENTIMPFVTKITTGFGGIAGKLTPLLSTVLNPLKMLFAPLITMLSGPLTAAFGSLAAAALPIIGIIAGIVAVGAILYSNWETIANVAQVVWDKVQACWGAAMERLQPAFESIGQSLDRLGTTFSSFGGQSTILETIFNTLGSVITAAFMVGITAIEVFVNAFAGAFEIISTTINEIGVIIQALAEGDWAAAWNSMGNIVSTIVSGIISTVSNMVSSVANGIKSIMGLSPGGGGAGVDVSANAEGGIYNKGAFLTTFAETGPEAAIPLNGSSRGQSLWEQAGEIAGYSTNNNSSSNSYNISIPVNISGSVDNSAVGNITSQIEEAVRRALANIEHNNRRLSFA